MTKQTELVIFEKLKPLEVFTEKGTESILNQIKKEKDNFEGDISTVQGRDEIRSFARKFATSKSKLDDLGKQLVSGWKDQAKLVDNERKKIRDTLDEWRDEVRQPLTDYEDKEKEHIEIRQKRIEEIEQLKIYITPSVRDSIQIETALKELDDLIKFDWQLFQGKAENCYNERKTFLKSELKRIEKREEEQAELEKLRKEKEEREKKEREEQIIRETGEDIRRVEREKADRVAKEAEEERYRLVAEKKAAEQAQINAEIRVKESAKIARAEREQAQIRAKKDQEEAVRLEKARAEAVRQKQIDEEKAREEDLKHRTKINNEATNAIAKYTINLDEEDEEADNIEALKIAKRVLMGIASGQIPNIFIKY